MLNQLLAAIEPILAEILGVVFLAMIGSMFAAVKRLFGAQVEQALRGALHSALDTGAQRQIGAAGHMEPAAEAVVDYVRRSVPDAVRKLGATDDVLRDLARAKLRKFGVVR